MNNKIITTKTGRKMYYLDGKLTTKDVFETALQADPDDVIVEPIDDPEMTTTSTTTLPPAKPAEKVCIFCGAFGDSTKYVNMRIVYLCEKHYLEKTTGEVAERL